MSNINQKYDPSPAYDPEQFLRDMGINPAGMSKEEISRTIHILAQEAMPYMSFEYYMRLLGAIRLLSEKALKQT